MNLPLQEKESFQEILNTASLCAAYLLKAQREEEGITLTQAVWRGCSWATDEGLWFLLCFCPAAKVSRVRKLPSLRVIMVTVQTWKVWELNLASFLPGLLLMHQIANKMDIIHLCPVFSPEQRTLSAAGGMGEDGHKWLRVWALLLQTTDSHPGSFLIS